MAITSTSANLYIGGSSSALTFNYLYLMCKTEIRFCFTTPNTAPIGINASESAFCPLQRSSSWMLGTASYKWYRIYAATVYGDTISGDTVNGTTVKGTTIEATSISATRMSGLTSLTVNGTIIATGISCTGTVTTANISADGTNTIKGTVRIGGSGGSIGFFGHSPQSRETYSYKSTSAIKNDTGGALVELVNCMLHLGLITV